MEFISYRERGNLAFNKDESSVMTVIYTSSECGVCKNDCAKIERIYPNHLHEM